MYFLLYTKSRNGLFKPYTVDLQIYWELVLLGIPFMSQMTIELIFLFEEAGQQKIYNK